MLTPPLKVKNESGKRKNRLYSAAPRIYFNLLAAQKSYRLVACHFIGNL
jgi:hypothetical protein